MDSTVVPAKLFGKLGDKADRREVLGGIVGEVGIKRWRRCMRAHVADDQRVTIRRRARGTRRSDRAASAVDILNYELLAEPFDELLADDSAGDVSGPAGRKRNDDGDRTRRIIEG